MRTTSIRATATALLLTCGAGPALAAWTTDPTVNLVVCSASALQDQTCIIPDGAGGAIIAWEDGRNSLGGDFDIYAQHVLAAGGVDPAWPVDGQAICTAPYSQSRPAMVPDGAGGAIIGWTDGRSGSLTHIYAQHLLATGVVDPAWPANGRAICTAANSQLNVQAASDGIGGAILAWEDGRNSPTLPDIYAQHVLGSGAVDPAWPADGRALCTAAQQQRNPRIITDQAGGAIVCWDDARVNPGPSPSELDLYAQHVLASGAVDPAWPVDGAAFCIAANGRGWGGSLKQPMVSDGAGGAIITWSDFRTYYAGLAQVYAQRVLASGVPAPGWPANGRALSSLGGATTYSQELCSIASDGAGGAVCAWDDSRSYGDFKVRAQRVSGAGTLLWDSLGVALSTTAGTQNRAYPVADGAGGAVVVWDDARSLTQTDMYAHHVTSGGALDGTWPVNGLAVCTNPAGRGVGKVVIASGSGGFIAAWWDSRFPSSATDVFAQRFDLSGVLGLPTWLEVQDGVPGAALAFAPAFPNPASRVATLRFVLPAAGSVRLSLYDAAGRIVRELANGSLTAGERSFAWDLRDAGDHKVSAGLYFARLVTDAGVQVRRVAVMR